MKKILLILCISFGSGMAAWAEDAEYSTDISKWVVIDQPSKNNRDKSRDFYHKANFSKYTWKVEITPDGVISRLDDLSQEDKKRPVVFDTTINLEGAQAKASQMLKVKDGWLAAYNEGEFGSAVYWFSQDGLDRKKLSDHQINQFVSEGNRVFAVEGLNHLGVSQGSMIEIKHEATGWEVTDFIPLPGAAEAIVRIGEGDYVVVTSKMLLRVNLQKEVLILVPAADWAGLYPNSVAFDSEFIYIGMRQFVARCRISKSIQPSTQLLIPAVSWLNSRQK